MGDEPFNSQTPNAKLGSIGLIGAMAAWRPTQGIYRFASSLLDSLWDTPVTGDLPSELLHRLPEWCVHIELGRSTSIGIVHGVWALIGYDLDEEIEELDLMLDVEQHGLTTIRLPLTGTLQQSLDVTRRDLRTTAHGDAARLLVGELHHAEMRKLAEPLLSVVLYLCSVNAEIASDGRAHPRTRPQPRSLRNGEVRWPGAMTPTVWATGTRLAAALQRSRERAATEPSDDGAPHVIPHVRRAHWHAYWLGAIDTPERRRELRWLPPIPVNLDEAAPPVATVRPVPTCDR